MHCQLFSVDREPYDARVSRTVLRAAQGEIPWAYSPTAQRPTFRDWCSAEAGNAFSREVCEHALAHSLPDKVEAAYRRGDLLEKRMLLMQAWGDCHMDQAQMSFTSSDKPLEV